MTLDQIKKQVVEFKPEYIAEEDPDWISIDFPELCDSLSLSYDISPETSIKTNHGEIAFSYMNDEEAFYGVYKGKDIRQFVKMIVDYYTGIGR